MLALKMEMEKCDLIIEVELAWVLYVFSSYQMQRNYQFYILTI